jgi:cobalamin-dependent methionine synthase I
VDIGDNRRPERAHPVRAQRVRKEWTLTLLEADRIKQARRIRDYGAGVVVMAFDEQGQADTAERKVSICGRAYDLLTQQAGFAAEDIVFDPNVLAVATGMGEHNGYAKAFIDALPLIKQRCPGARTSGGTSNLSFSFRGNDVVREATDLHRCLDAAITAIAALHHDNTLLRQELAHHRADVLPIRPTADQ